MLTEHLSKMENAPVVVLFGGNPQRRDEVIQQLSKLGEVTIYGTLSEQEGIEKIRSLTKIDLVLIGGRYSDEQRVRIRKFVSETIPHTPMTEPGIDYPYESEAIKQAVKEKLGF